jgi:Alpha-lytic protease prodomain/Trypsin
VSLLSRTSRARRHRARTILAATASLLAVLAAAPAATHAAAAPAPLAAASTALARADIAGTAWYADPATGRLVVTADSRVDARGLARAARAARATGLPPAALTIRRTPGVLRPLIAGGQPVYAPGVRCTLGFNARNSGGQYFALVAGHCLAQATTWYIDAAMTKILGTVSQYSFPGNDFGVIQYVNPAYADGRVYLYNGTYQDITQAAAAYVGETVSRSGYATGLHTGTVTALNATVNYGGGDIVYGLVQTTVCAEPGDSGGPYFRASSALGLASGGSGNCTTGGTTYFQPVTEALSAYGLTVF